MKDQSIIIMPSVKELVNLFQEDWTTKRLELNASKENVKTATRKVASFVKKYQEGRFEDDILNFLELYNNQTYLRKKLSKLLKFHGDSQRSLASISKMWNELRVKKTNISYRVAASDENSGEPSRNSEVVKVYDPTIDDDNLSVDSEFVGRSSTLRRNAELAAVTTEGPSLLESETELDNAPRITKLDSLISEVMGYLKWEKSLSSDSSTAVDSDIGTTGIVRPNAEDYQMLIGSNPYHAKHPYGLTLNELRETDENRLKTLPYTNYL